MNKCEGNCDNHYGKIQRVHVSDNGKDWGHYNYCQVAINEDKSRGLQVELIKETQNEN